MITCFTSTGFNRLVRSLIRFCAMNRYDAVSLVYLCACANGEAYTAAKPYEREGMPEVVVLSLWGSYAPYQTEVQLYRAMQTLDANMRGGCGALQEAQARFRALINDVADRFQNSFNMDIQDERTVYAFCDESLDPALEPTVCLLSDWRQSGCEPVCCQGNAV